MNESTTRILVIDLGSTYFKCAVMKVGPSNRCAALKVRRLRVDQATWDVNEATDRFAVAVADVIHEAKKLAASTGPVAVGITGVREGVAVCRLNGELLRVVSNTEGISRQEQYGSQWLAEIETGLGNAEATFTSLQGWLAFALTGRLVVGECELRSWTVAASTSSLVTSPAYFGTHFIPPIVPVGAVVGRSPLLGGLAVVIAGTDECACHYGVGLGQKASTELGAGTYWSLSRALSTSHCDLPANIRILPAMPPYSEIASFVGYRWGEYIYALQQGRRPRLPQILPSWSKSRFIDGLSKNGSLSFDHAVELICEDLLEASVTLPLSSGTEEYQLAVHGGGSLTNKVIREVLSTTGWKATYLEVDPTLVGSALITARCTLPG